jgi:hypothetical protein
VAALETAGAAAVDGDPGAGGVVEVSRRHPVAVAGLGDPRCRERSSDRAAASMPAAASEPAAGGGASCPTSRDTPPAERERERGCEAHLVEVARGWSTGYERDVFPTPRCRLRDPVAEAGDGVEVFLLRRRKNASFMGGAFVFPGGAAVPARTIRG